MKSFAQAITITVLFLSFSALSAQVPVLDDPCLVLKEYLDGQLTAEYTYDDAGRYTGVRMYQDGKLTQSRVVKAYADNGTPSEIHRMDGEGKLNGIIKSFRDDHGLVTKMELYRVDDDGSTTLWRRHEYTNDPAADCKLQGVNYYDDGGNLMRKSSIMYSDDNCSSFSVIMDKDGKPTGTEAWIRDDRRSPEHIGSAFHYQSEHNRVTFTVLNADGSVADGSYTTENIEYNEHGYPVKSTIRFADGSTKVYTAEYSCGKE